MIKILLFAFAFLALQAQTIINGDIEIYAVNKNDAKDLIVDGEKKRWLTAPNDKDILFFIIGANYHKNGSIKLQNGDNNVFYNVIKGEYKKEKISVSQDKAIPPKSVLERINAERDEANKIYSTATQGLKIDKKFNPPMNSVITSEFGSARVFNEVVKSYHGGTDFRAAVGSVVKASNDGVVVIAKDRYYAGGSVVIDHGEGIYTQYYHLSKIDVKVGDNVKNGDKIGFSGATGRVSGPHLHFGVIADGVQVNPLNFIKKINEFLN